MRNFKLLFISLVVSCSMMSCSTTVPLFVTENPVGDKTGTSSNSCLFTYSGYGVATARSATMGDFKMTSAGLCFNSKDYGIQTAAENANIEKVATVDINSTWYVFFTKYEVKVTGE